MHTYIIRRLLLMLPVLLIVSVVVFLIMNLTPGDPVVAMLGAEASQEQVQQIRKTLGLDKPILTRYFDWLGRVLQGDFGVSLRNQAPVMPTLIERLPATVKLTFAAVIVALFIGIPTGIISAVSRNSLFDNLARVIALTGVSMPGFWLGLLGILAFAYYWRIFPPSGRGTIAHLVLPAASLGTAMTGLLMRLTRSSMLEVLTEDYIRTARSKGLQERVVLYRHALRNALLPVITIVGLQIGTLLGGTVVIETVFAWPGLGRFTFQKMLQRDYPMVMGSLMLFAFFFSFVNLLTDIAYGLINPQIRYR